MKESPLLSSFNFNSMDTTGSISCDLTSLPCSLNMHRNSGMDEITKLIEEARFLILSMKQVILFLLLIDFHLIHIQDFPSLLEFYIMDLLYFVLQLFFLIK